MILTNIVCFFSDNRRQSRRGAGREGMGEERQKGWEGVEKGQSEFNESLMEVAQ